MPVQKSRSPFCPVIVAMLRAVGVGSRVASTTHSRGISTSASTAGARVPAPYNEPIKSYLRGSPERVAIEAKIKEFRSKVIEIPLVINGKEVKTGDIGEVRIPHEHSHVLARFHRASEKHVKEAIEGSMKAKQKWKNLDFESRTAIFLKMADLVSGPYRAAITAATVLGQSKNYYQAEIDSACETVDFLRFNAHWAQQMTQDQTVSPPGIWNRFAYRPLEGFVYGITPFNFTAIAANLACAPASLGNTVVWKPSDHALFSSWQLMQIYREAGVPEGVINFIPGDPAMITNVVLASSDLAGVHYTGSTAVFRNIWKQIGDNAGHYKSFPRIVGETGGKDFIFAHESANVPALVTAMIRGAFEYAGQKCSAASRAYIPANIWPQVRETLLKEMNNVKMGSPEEPTTLVNAVIHKGAFDRCKRYIDTAQKNGDKIVWGGKCDDSKGWFVEPTIVQVNDATHTLLREEIFGPILTVYVYPEQKWKETLKECDDSVYGLTGAVFAQDRYAIAEATDLLEDAAGNFYINDKPTGAVVGQQPFGGARSSGTNDKAGSILNLHRWVSARTLKETFVPPTSFTYPYMLEDQ